ncbi:MAG: HDOD domain-containing protein [gamma proteobacterium symbiont of Taylorina sp.]|nr:HDOD domain-containing protein [gamma proteobacterium symbiont of Taylorina sp.]
MQIIKIPAGKNIIELNSQTERQFFLLDGIVKVNDASSTQWLIHAQSENARSPLSRLRPSQYNVESHSATKLVVFDLETVFQFADKSAHINSSKKIQQHPLYQQLITDLHENKLELPTIPDVAIKIRRALSDENSDFHQVALIISSDPAITTKIIKTANSALYRSVHKITDCHMAVTRLGTKVTSQLVTSFSMKELFKTKNRLLKKKMAAVWNHSREIAALSFVLAKITPGFEPEQALLAGLLHDIGAIPIISYADKHPEIFKGNQMLDALINELKGEVGAAILTKWNFSDDIITTAREAEVWLRLPGEKPQYCDIIILAQLHAIAENSDNPPVSMNLPRLDEVPAFSKLALGQLTPELSIKVLEQAKEQVKETLNLLA